LPHGFQACGHETFVAVLVDGLYADHHVVNGKVFERTRATAGGCTAERTSCASAR
jgi:hypothetical protein